MLGWSCSEPHESRRVRNARSARCVSQRFNSQRLRSWLELCFQVRRNQTAHSFFWISFAASSAVCARGFSHSCISLQSRDSQLGVLREPPAITGNLAYGKLQKRTQGCSQGQGGLKLNPLSARAMSAAYQPEKGLISFAQRSRMRQRLRLACHWERDE